MAIVRRAAYGALQAVGRVLDLGARATMYLAAGTLHRDELSAAIASRWNGFAVTEEAVLSGLWDWERRWYPRHLRADDRALLVGCGTGRDLIGLIRLGYHVDGLELVPESATLARAMLLKLGLRAQVITGAIEDAALPGPYDAVIFSWYSYSYIATRARRVATLGRVGTALAPGGRILLSYVIDDAPPRTLPLAFTRVVGALARTDWRPEPGDKIWAGDRPRSLHYEHQFRRGEIEGEAGDAGLRVVSHERDDDGRAVLVSA
jgi:SAM-dependent methyltransferase